MGDLRLLQPAPPRRSEPMAFCPACNHERLPGLLRCSGVHGVRCRAHQCPCGAVVNGQLRCRYCDALQGVELIAASIEIEPDDGPRGRARPPATVRMVVDVNGSGCVWVNQTSWPRMDNRYAVRAVLRRAFEIEATHHEIVGTFVKLAKDAQSLQPDRLSQLAALDGQTHHLVLREPTPHWTLEDAAPTLEIKIERLLKLADLFDEKEYVRGDTDQPLVGKARMQAAHELVLEEIGRLVRWERVRLDLNGDAHHIKRLLENRSPVETPNFWWSSHEVAGRVFCGGSCCPGRDWYASEQHPHPEECLAPGEAPTCVNADFYPPTRTSLTPAYDQMKANRLTHNLGHQSPAERGKAPKPMTPQGFLARGADLRGGLA